MNENYVVFMPVMGRPKMVQNAVNSFVETSKQIKLVVVEDGNFRQPQITNPDPSRVYLLHNNRRLGFWGTLNRMMNIFEYPVIGYFGGDVIFHPGWERRLIERYPFHFPSQNGLLAIRDDLWDDHHASHAFIGKKLLEAIYGFARFPDEYGHFYADSEIVQFTRDLDMFRYESTIHIEHLHPDKKKRVRDEVDDKAFDFMTLKAAKKMYDERYLEWKNNGKEKAIKRLLDLKKSGS